MGTYAEHDAQKVIVLVSDDAGATWYPRGGDPASARPQQTQDATYIVLESGDAGVTWEPQA